MATWNHTPSSFADKLGPVEPTSRALRSIGVYAAVAVAAAGMSRYGWVGTLPRSRARTPPAHPGQCAAAAAQANRLGGHDAV